MGREAAAVEFARLLLCERPRVQPNAGRLAHLPEAFPLRSACGQCRSCVTLSAGTNPDFRLVRRDLARFHDDPNVRNRVMQELSIDVIRQFLIAPARLGAVGGRGKVFLVHQAETMSASAQNALLKTLEEPPAGVTIILLCPTETALLPTTRSRCRCIRFRPLPVDLAAESLTKQGLEPMEAKFWAGLTGGSVGASQRLAGSGLYEHKARIVEDLAALTPARVPTLAESLRKVTQRQADRLKRRDEGLVDSLAGRQAGQDVLAVLASAYRDALTLACGAERELVHADQRPAVARIARRFGPIRLAEILTQLARYEQLLWRNVNAKVLWDNVAVTCASAAPLAV